MVFQVQFYHFKMKFQRQGHLTNWVRILQILLATISLALSIAVVATAAHTYHLFHSQRGANNSWWLPLWPGHFDTTGTKAYIGTASAVAFLSLVFLAAGVIPAVRAGGISDNFDQLLTRCPDLFVHSTAAVHAHYSHRIYYFNFARRRRYRFQRPSRQECRAEQER